VNLFGRFGLNGATLGALVGASVGTRLGVCVGLKVGERVGARVGLGFVGVREGASVGTRVGRRVGLRVGDRVGLRVGESVAGRLVGVAVGLDVGLFVGRPVGLDVGRSVGLFVMARLGFGLARQLRKKMPDKLTHPPGLLLPDTQTTLPSRIRSTRAGLALLLVLKTIRRRGWQDDGSLAIGRPHFVPRTSPVKKHMPLTDVTVTRPYEPP